MNTRARMIFIASALLALCGCDRLSRIHNESAGPLTVRYWHTNYHRWSPPMKAGPDQTIHIPPGHHLQDASCLEIIEGSRRFVYDNAALRGVQLLCRKTNGCTVRYLGQGKLHISGAGGASRDQARTLPADKRCKS